MLITRRVEFSSSHRCAVSGWSDQRNREVFGEEANPYGHGHNYVLEVTLSGKVDEVTGMIVDLKDVKAILNREVVEPMDHRYLNAEVPPFDKVVPTAENVARAVGIDTAEQHALVLHRYAQYEAARASRFHARFMDLPFEVPGGRRGQPALVLDGDEGVQPADAARIARLRPLVEGGTVTHAGQTHPADGNAGMIVADRDRAHALSADPAITIELVAFGQARERKAMMPAAPIPAAQQALDRAGIGIRDVAAIKSHNPFIVNDIAFARHFGIAAEGMNNNGCSLVWGHPQGPTGMRAVIELIEELAQRGGGYGLFHGCAAGDSAMAVVIRVGSRA